MSGRLLNLFFLFVIMVLALEISASTRTDHWGKGWSDDDKDCQDTRAEMLIRTSKDKIKFKRVGGVYDQVEANRGNHMISGKSFCHVTQGEWFDPYTGITVHVANDLDLDHVVPLNHAWEMGAAKWPMSRRRAYYNDFDNLLLVSKGENRSKGDKGILEYLPKREAFRCEYAQLWEFIKKKWGLTISRREAQKIVDVKSRYCKAINR